MLPVAEVKEVGRFSPGSPWARPLSNRVLECVNSYLTKVVVTSHCFLLFVGESFISFHLPTLGWSSLVVKQCFFCFT